MTFKSHIYDRKQITTDNSSWLFAIVLLLTWLLAYLLMNINETLGIIVLLIAVVGYFYNMISNWVTREEEGRYVGELVLKPDEFLLQKESIKISDISDLKFEIRSIKGYKYSHRFGYTIDSGTKNCIAFVLRGERRYYNFKLNSDKHIGDLKLVLEGLYEKGIFVKEFYHGERTYLLERLD